MSETLRSGRHKWTEEASNSECPPRMEQKRSVRSKESLFDSGALQSPPSPSFALLPEALFSKECRRVDNTYIASLLAKAAVVRTGTIAFVGMLFLATFTVFCIVYTLCS